MRRPLLHSILIAATLAADQLTKHWAREFLHLPREFFGGVLTLVLTQNSGAFLSLGASLPPGARTLIFSLIVAIGLGAAAWALFRGKLEHPGEAAALALVIGGGAGNLVDRLVFHGRVTDFLYLAAGPLHTGVFNVADVAITSGVIWLLVASVGARREGGREGAGREGA